MTNALFNHANRLHVSIILLQHSSWAATESTYCVQCYPKAWLSASCDSPWRCGEAKEALSCSTSWHGLGLRCASRATNDSHKTKITIMMINCVRQFELFGFSPRWQKVQSEDFSTTQLLFTFVPAGPRDQHRLASSRHGRYP